MEKDIALVFDCGSTNVRVIAIDVRGNILASKASSNNTDKDPFFPGGLIWDLNTLWNKLRSASVEVMSQIEPERIAGVTVTTFGVDGTLVDENGQMLYPIISWQCKRTEPIMNSVEKYMPLERLYKISGIYPYAFNTINKLIWFQENQPTLLRESHRFLFIPSLILHKLTGEIKNDITMAGTSMLMDAADNKFSEDIFSSLEIDPSLFGDLASPGEQAGVITKEANDASGIPTGTPVFFAGHDTQFAIYGSGAGLNQPVLSSGTWEVLMVRSRHFSSGKEELEKALTTELDAQTGIFNIGQNWLGSGVLEWFSRNFYPTLKGSELYETMIDEAETIKPGSHGLSIDPEFYNDSGNPNGGTIVGLTINTSRAEIYRALLESLAYRLREGLESLQQAGNFKADKIICVGGGSQNRLWNQIRADVCNIPFEVIDQKETTVLGAALFVFAGSGLYASTDKARQNIPYNPQVIHPSAESGMYNEQYREYQIFKH